MRLGTAAVVGCLYATTALAGLDSVVEDSGSEIFDEIVGNTKSSGEDAENEDNGIEHPPVPVLEKPETAVLFEQFQDGEAPTRWKASNAKKDEEFSYVGKWGFEEPTVFPGFSGDKGLVMNSPAAHHAISTRFDKPFDNADNTLVLQYEVKLQKGLECGGAYMKLLSENAALHQKEFSSESPYQVMFGPDKCGSTNKVHFIIRRKDQNTGEYEEKHLTLPPIARLNKLTNLYTLVIHPDQEFEIRINGEVSRAGNLREEGAFKPSFDPPKEIEDPNDFKPDDWEDEEYIPDPDQAEKPADWDEDAPFQIPDPEAEKPEDWDEDMPAYIPDPEAEKPEDWDEEEDGEWVAPEVSNPECDDHGCGPWEAPLIRNPDYKGKWVQPKIPNPNYQGEWSPQLIANPDYFEDSTPSNLEPIGGIGFELWTMQNQILFDNIYLGHSVEEAESIGNKTFVPKHKIEEAEEEATAPPPTKKESKSYESALEFLKDDPKGYIVEILRVFILNFSDDPVSALKNQPAVAFSIAVTMLSGFALVFGTLNAILYGIKSAFKSSPAPKQQHTKKKQEGEEPASAETKTAAGKSTGTSTTTSATKRKT